MLQAARYHDCEEIGAWHKRIKNHLWRCIEYAINNGVDANPIFNTCLMHVRGVHKWPEEKLTGPYTKCYHDPVSRPCHESLMLDGKAFRKFEDIIMTESFQQDMANSSPYGDIAVYNLQKALDRFYCRKDIHYPPSIYPFCSLMATMHVNSWRMWEIYRRREQIQKRKRHKRLATNSPTKHTWRKSIFDEVLKERLLALEKSQNSGETSEYVHGLIAAEEYYERDL
ncbi:hypothetical protein TELCIR_26285 [Teladorsagia circumcincta]|uniref:Uncharacterized protein n=1 Tax=Teladorsagia circumcincta TaxID=45464 RepID=A0A2G9T390_TELCI|nr:hypothetical protein TELCIR_26285 [Teladorsagia circumcincta]